MGVSRKIESLRPRTLDGVPIEGQGRIVLAEPQRDHVSPEARLAEHRASMANRGPNPGTVRLTIRHKLGDEKPLVRKMYDKTAKQRRKGKKS